MTVNGRDHLWAIVLAAGDGERVSALTTDAGGSVVPKQYWSFDGDKTMLRWALDRLHGIVRADHIVAVVAAQHRRFWASELSELPRENVVIQPRNRGTAAGLLLPLLHVLLRLDADARVAVLPSDHYVAHEGILRRALREAARPAQGAEERVVLLGMRPGDFDAGYGWIVPSVPFSGSVGGVAGFVEKPNREAARTLMEGGALVNAFTLVGNGSALVRLYEETLPELLDRFMRSLRQDAPMECLEKLYATIPEVDFSRDVLERSPCRLSVLPVPECGWSDLGTIARIESFQGAVRGMNRPRLPPTIASSFEAA
jgi:mannose-1-phosphate guanylyltransferase